MAQDDIIIKAIQDSASLHEAVELQKVYWGDNMGDIVPHHMLLSLANYGGHVFGAYVGGRMVGLLMGFIGAEVQPDDTTDARQRLLVMSKRMVVLPEYRNYKIGEKLKMAQRDFALRHNIPLVTWTFDPLLSRNAYLNLHKLGAIGQKYEANYFGTGADANPTLTGDRLAANWWVAHPHVEEHLTRTYDEGVIINRIENHAPTGFDLPNVPTLLLEIPADFVALERLYPQAGAAWREHVRTAFSTLLGAGYLATDVLRRGDRTFYVFTRDDGTFHF